MMSGVGSTYRGGTTHRAITLPGGWPDRASGGTTAPGWTADHTHRARKRQPAHRPATDRDRADRDDPVPGLARVFFPSSCASIASCSPAAALRDRL